MHFGESLYVPIIGSQGAGIETRAAHQNTPAKEMQSVEVAHSRLRRCYRKDRRYPARSVSSRVIGIPNTGANCASWSV